MNRLEQIAQCMLDQHNLKQNFENLPETLMPKDFDEAYETQKIFQENSGRGSLGGFKIALASKVQQQGGNKYADKIAKIAGKHVFLLISRFKSFSQLSYTFSEN